LGNGVSLLPFSNEIMAACYAAANELYEETAAKNAKSQKGLRAMESFPQ
jgi:TRAP-type mannitol/chloroaromatic compound transport system substrate-binding protein